MKKQHISTINSAFIVSKVMTRKKKIWSYITSTMDLKHNNYRISSVLNNGVHIMLGSWNVPFSYCTNAF